MITSNINGLNTPIKRQSSSDLIKKQDPPTCCLQEVHLSKYKDTNIPKKENYASTNQKKAEMTAFHTHLQGDFKSDDETPSIYPLPSSLLYLVNF